MMRSPFASGSAAALAVLAAALAAPPCAAQAPQDKPYTIESSAPAEAAVGKPQVARLAVVPAAGYHTNKDFPTRLTITPPAGVTVAKPALGAKDAKQFSDARAEFEVGFSPTAAGDHEIQVDFRFAVCTPKTCIPARERLSWKVRVR